VNVDVVCSAVIHFILKSSVTITCSFIDNRLARVILTMRMAEIELAYLHLTIKHARLKYM